MAIGIILGGTAGDNFMNGTGADDVIHGNGGADILNGMEGNDQLFSGTVYDAATNTNKPDTVGDLLDGGPGDDRMIGGDGRDRLFGGPGSDNMSGGAGLDTAYIQVLRTNAAVSRSGDVVTVQSSLGTDVLDGVERLVFNDLAVGLDLDGNAGKMYRLYQAAFDRAPDHVGLGFWIDAVDRGVTFMSVSRDFTLSPEFAQLYGANVSNDAYLTALYANALNRTPDADGYKFWIDALNGGVSRESVLIDFAESTENKAQVIGSIENGIVFDPWG